MPPRLESFACRAGDACTDPSMRWTSQICEEERRRPVTVLALGSKTDRLLQGGLRTLGEMLDDAAAGFPQLRRLPGLGRQSVQLVQERLGVVGSCACPDGKIDWQGFSRLCGFAPADETASSGPLSAEDRAVPIAKLHLGARTDRIAAGGLTSAGDLLDDRDVGYRQLKRAPRLGEAAVVLVDRRLRTLEACRAPDGDVDWVMFDALCLGQVVKPQLVPSPPAPPAPSQIAVPQPLSARASGRPVEVLRLGPKAKFLRQAGISTIGHLQREGVQSRLSRLAGVGPGTTEIIRTRLSDLVESVDNNGDPRWDAVAASWGYPVTPKRSLATGDAFVECIADVITCWIEAHESEADRLILSERLVRSREGRLKLDALGKRLGVTRERVRQREKKLLDGLCDALLADDQSRSPVQFSADFRSWWERAAQLLSETSSLSWPGFVSGLERAWGVPAARLTAILPLALAILTDGEQVVPPRTAIPVRLLEPLSPALLRRSIRSLPVGRAADDLEDAGCTSFGALLLAAMENRLPQGRSGEAGARMLHGIAKAVNPDGDVDADGLAAALQMPLMPTASAASGEAFLDLFNDAVENALRLGPTTERAAEVWRIRTRFPAAIRPTLEETGAQLSTWGPTVKREETLLLAALNAQLVEGDQTNAGVIWRGEFLDFAAEAARVREETGGKFEAFITCLARRWAIDEEPMQMRAAGLWAVLSLYPNGRRSPVRGRREKNHIEATTSEPAPIGLIVLRGFRRVH